jgi:hypothetical protein
MLYQIRTLCTLGSNGRVSVNIELVVEESCFDLISICPEGLRSIAANFSRGDLSAGRD